MAPVSGSERLAPIPGFQRAVLDWAPAGWRDLPWRRTRDPWAILVSELMLQQTQVSRVVPRYTAFLRRFPDPLACRRAGAGAVVEAWDGLGYNRRAVNLYRAAVVIADDFGGRVPDELEDLLSLAGVGPYTARAVLVFAFERPVAVVDSNVARLVARAIGSRPLNTAEVQTVADGLVPPGQGWAWNQALLDLGATVCTKRAPSCCRCPLAAGHCRWQASGGVSLDPSVGSAGVGGGQSRFEGSDRQGRGRLVAALRSGPVSLGEVAATAGWPDDPQRSARAADGLVADGLAVIRGGMLELP